MKKNTHLIKLCLENINQSKKTQKERSLENIHLENKSNNICIILIFCLMFIYTGHQN